jgi:hypothetical protein
MNAKALLLISLISLALSACSAFNYGFTEDKAFGKCMIVTKDPQSFGYKRLKYNKGLHSSSELGLYLKQHTWPEYIYEYSLPNGCDGIKLFYTTKDSVFVFEELGSLSPETSRLTEARNISIEEKEKLKLY